jgi:hypothetical protein
MTHYNQKIVTVKLEDNSNNRNHNLLLLLLLLLLNIRIIYDTYTKVLADFV